MQYGIYIYFLISPTPILNLSYYSSMLGFLFFLYFLSFFLLLRGLMTALVRKRDLIGENRIFVVKSRCKGIFCGCILA